MNTFYLPKWSVAKNVLLTLHVATIASIFTVPQLVSAQVIPDDSLGTNPSVVVPESATRDLIEGGVRQDTSLFHSFQDFNIDNGNSVYFANPADVEAIFTRVTGTNLSQLDGTLGVLGNADLFLLNPNGIIFGTNSQLDINGSFTASTADSLEWADGSRFSALNPTAPPLLAINLIPGIQHNLSAQAADITVQTNQLNTGQDLNLFAGNLDIQGFLEAGRDITLTALETIQMGELDGIFNAIANRNFIIDAGNQTLIEDIVVASDISITTGSLMVFNGAGLSVEPTAGGEAGNLTITATETVTFDTGASSVTTGAVNRVFSDDIRDGGDIAITANRLELLNGAIISTSTSGQGDAGKVIINVNEATLLEGEDRSEFGSGVFSQVNSIGQGNSQGIFLTTGTLTIRDGGELSTTTRGQGNAGPVRVVVREAAVLDGFSGNGFETGIFSNADRLNGKIPRGSAGSVFISAESLDITNGAFIGSNAFGIGNPGSVTIQVSDDILIAGSQPGDRNSGVFTQVADTANSLMGGKISITADSLRIIGGFITAATSGEGPAGTISIDASELVLLEGLDDGLINGISTLVDSNARGNGGEIQLNTSLLMISKGAELTAETRGSGNGGSITINADAVELNTAGQLTASTSSDFDAGSINLQVVDSLSITGEDSGIFSEATESSTGNAGSIFIDPTLVILQEGAEIRVANQGEGIGGNIQLIAGQLILNDNTSISAETASNQGGDIEILVDDVVLLRNDSNISATAGIAEAEGDGGNVTINTNFLISPLDEDNNITANAFLGKGGNVEITALGTYGISFQGEEIPVRNDITASSAFGITGEVDVNTLDLDPTSDTANLPSDTGIPTISQQCSPSRSISSFVATGRGGVPLGPEDAISSQDLWEDFYTPDPETTTAFEPNTQWSTSEPILAEAQGWTRNTNGNIELLATAKIPPDAIPTAAICSHRGRWGR